MNTSYKRYYETGVGQTVGLSLAIGAFATTATYPMEFIKTRIQLKSELIGMRGQYSINWGYNPFKEMRLIHQTGKGLSQFFFGVDSALASRLSHLMIRNFIYKVIYDQTKPRKLHNDLTIKEKSLIAGIAGSVAAIASNPFELVMVRQIHEGTLPVSNRQGYSSLAAGMSKIIQEEGIQVLFGRGLSMNILKALMLNISLTGPFDFANERLWVTFGDVHFTKPLAIIWASIFGTFASIPFDNIKTKLQKQLPNSQLNRVNYASVGHCIEMALKVEGPLTFFSGAQTYYGKVLLYSLLTVYVTDAYLVRKKRQLGLSEWQI